MKEIVLKKARIVLFPNYITLGSTFDFSPEFGRFLVSRNVGVYAEYYEGNVDSIPQTNGVATFVRYSTKAKCSEEDLAEACEEFGFLCFFDDQLITREGWGSTKNLLETASEYLSKY